MLINLASVSVVVKDYDEAIKWFTEVLDLELRMDGSMGSDHRFITVGVRGQEDISIVLHKSHDWATDSQSSIHGLLFHTDDCRQEVDRLRQHGVKIAMEPEVQPWGVQAVFEDLYGNTHVLVEPSPMAFQRGSVEV